jgi:tetratricopeptide (TPR) repeat protein
MRNSPQMSRRTNRYKPPIAGLTVASREVECTARLLITALVFLSLGIQPVTAATALSDATDPRICNTNADYFLEIEDYAKAIRSHEIFLKSHPNDALAHYHLGFAYGMMGRPDAELREYLRAIDLGLYRWDLFLNVGLAYLNNGSITPALRALYLATVSSPAQPDAHFNLALAYERAGMFDQAKEEVLVSIRLDSQQPDAWNTLAVIYAEQGDRVRAGKLLCDLVQVFPDYVPARNNLRTLERADEFANLKPGSSTASAVSEKPAQRNLMGANESESLDGCPLPSVRDGNDSVGQGYGDASTEPGTDADATYSSQVLIIPAIGARQ